jgi:DNA-binding SARP family transcriptional activator
MSEFEARGGVTEISVSHLDYALSLYRAAFLAGEEADWVLAVRERLQSRYLQGLLNLGHFWEETGQWQKAVECYQKGLRVDEFAEEFYQRLMCSYERLGLRAEALATYEQCWQALQNAFGATPSSKTETIYQSIRGSGRHHE